MHSSNGREGAVCKLHPLQVPKEICPISEDFVQESVGPDNPRYQADLWASAKSWLKRTLDADVFAWWFERLEFVDVFEGVLRLSVPTDFIAHFVRTHYAPAVLDAWRKSGGSADRIVLTVRSSLVRKAPPTPEWRARSVRVPVICKANIASGSEFNPSFDLSWWRKSDANAMATAAISSLADAAPPAWCPVFLHGPSGVGKTHLVQSMAIAAASSNASPAYFSAEGFSRLTAEIEKGSTAAEAAFGRATHLVVDGVHAIRSGAALDVLAVAVEFMRGKQRPVVLVANCFPRDWQGATNKLHGALLGGLICEITSPAFDDKVRIFEAVYERACRLARFRDPATPQVIDAAVAFAHTGRDLQAIATRIVAEAALTRRAISVEMVDRAVVEVKRATEARKPKVDDFMRAVCAFYGVSRADLVSPRRSRHIVGPRQMAMYLCREDTRRSFPEIGRAFGNRDHTTALHAHRKVSELLATDRSVANDCASLRRLAAERVGARS